METLTGRRRYIPEITSRNFNVRSFGERAATNAPIQGTAADLIKIAMIEIQRDAPGRRRSAARMLLQVHDELLFETPRDEAEATLAPGPREDGGRRRAAGAAAGGDRGSATNWLECK